MSHSKLKPIYRLCHARLRDNQTSLSRARDGMHGKEEKKMQKRSKRKIMDPKWKTITKFVVVLTRVSDVLVEIFAGT